MFPNSGNRFFHSLPVPELWEWTYPLPFLFPNSQKSFPLSPALEAQRSCQCPQQITHLINISLSSLTALVSRKNTDPINAPTTHVTVLVFVLVYLFTHDSIKPTSTLTLGSFQSPPASLYVPLNGCPHLIQSLGRIKPSEDGILSTAAQHHHALLGLLGLSRLC